MSSLPIADSRFVGKELPLFSISAGASPFTYTNTLNQVLAIIVSGGVVTSISIVRGTLSLSTGLTAGLFILDPGDSITVAYTAAPSMIGIPL